MLAFTISISAQTFRPVPVELAVGDPQDPRTSIRLEKLVRVLVPVPCLFQISGINCAFSMLLSAISTVLTPVFRLLLFCLTADKSSVIPGADSDVGEAEPTSRPCQCRLFRMGSNV